MLIGGALLGPTIKAVQTVSAVVAADANNLDAGALLRAAGWNGISAVDGVVTIASGKVVGSLDRSIAFLVPVLPPGSTFRLVNNGYIVGAGGPGGYSGAGYNAGSALQLLYPTTIVNNGTIGGGGGGGGSGSFLGGGGGAGKTGGAKGADGRGGSKPGTLTAGGAGAVVSTYDDYGNLTSTAKGGTGGALGQKGQSSSGIYPAYVGGIPGAACIGNSYATWEVLGTQLGSITA